MPVIRVAVFVDGANLHHRLRVLAWPLQADIGAFGKRLAGNRRFVGVTYYNVPPPSHLTRTARNNQTGYYRRLEQDPRVKIKLGYLQRRVVNGAPLYEEKGVDVSLTVDMLTGAFRDDYDVAVLVSSDGDFRPLVEAVRSIGKRVEYIFFPGTVRSTALMHICNVARKCRRAWLTEFPE